MATKAVVFCGAAAVSWNPDFLSSARRRGLAVLALEAPGTRYAEAALQAAGDAVAGSAMVEPGDIGALITHVGDWSQAYDIVGMCALREDWVEATAVLADRLGVPSLGPRAASICRNKRAQREVLAALSPRWSELTRDTLGEWEVFPAVVKPVDGMGSTGVTPVSDRRALCAAFDEAPAGAGLLVEERTVGAEYSVESLVQAGEIVFAGVTGKRTAEDTSGWFVELAHTVPAFLSPESRAVLLEANSAVVRAIGARNGILHTEFRLTPTGEAVVTEVNGRCPGGSIPSLYRLATGVSLEDAVVALATGAEVTYPDPTRCARQVYLDHPEGVLDDVVMGAGCPAPVWLAHAGTRPPLEPAEEARAASLRAVTVIKPRGATLTAPRSNQDRAVTCILDAPTHAELDRLEAGAIAAIHIIIRREGEPG